MQIVHLRFQHPPEALHRAVVNAASYSGHTLPHFCSLQLVIESFAGILKSSVTMEQRMGTVQLVCGIFAVLSTCWYLVEFNFDKKGVKKG